MFYDGFITFQDIMDRYNYTISISVATLIIIYILYCDCSYSSHWVQTSGEYLDNIGVQPCGHSARNKGILSALALVAIIIVDIIIKKKSEGQVFV